MGRFRCRARCAAAPSCASSAIVSRAIRIRSQKRAVKQSLQIEKLHRTHNVEQFTCGQPELDRFLTRHALQAQQANSSQTYVAVKGDEVAGFYTIVAGEVQHAQAPERVVKGMARHPIPL